MNASPSTQADWLVFVLLGFLWGTGPILDGIAMVNARLGSHLSIRHRGTAAAES
jgi:hypothetical protein